MKIKIVSKIFSSALGVIALLFALSNFAYAKVISLYDQPKADSKIVGTVDLSAGIVPIFTPKEGDWMKVGDPKNGNVGWIKRTELNSEAGSAAAVTKVINEGNKPPYTYQAIQYGQPFPKLTDEQAKQLQMRQREIQESLQKSVQTLMQDMSTVINQLPALMPVIVMPPPSQTQPSKPAVETKTQTKTISPTKQ